MTKKAERGVTADELKAARTEAQRRIEARGAGQDSPRHVRLAKFTKALCAAQRELDRAFPSPFEDLRRQAYDGLMAAVMALNQLGRRESPDDASHSRDATQADEVQTPEQERLELQIWASRTHVHDDPIEAENITIAMVLHERGASLYEATRAIFPLRADDEYVNKAALQRVVSALAVKEIDEETAAELDQIMAARIADQG